MTNPTRCHEGMPRQSPRLLRCQKTDVQHTGSSINARQAPRIVILPRFTFFLVLFLLLSPVRGPTCRLHVFVENVIRVTQPRPFVSSGGTAYPGQPEAFIIQPTNPRIREDVRWMVSTGPDTRFRYRNIDRVSNQGKRSAIAKRRELKTRQRGSGRRDPRWDGGNDSEEEEKVSLSERVELNDRKLRS